MLGYNTMTSSSVIVIEKDSCLNIKTVFDIATGSLKVALSDDIVSGIEAARQRYLQDAREKWVYGYCTGLGELQHHGTKCTNKFEEVVLREHDSTIGPYTNPIIVRTAMTVRLIQLSRGGAPVRPIIALRLADAVNKGITPLVPLYGSVGASGDLAPFSRIARCIFLGEGTALYQGKVTSCDEALHNAGLNTIELDVGESLAFINTTAWSTALGIVYTQAARRLLDLLLDTLSEALSIIECNKEHFDTVTYKGKRYNEISQILKRLKGTSKCNKAKGQDPYSIRCIPVTLATLYRVIARVEETLEREACSSVENPVVTDEGVRHGCLFYTYPVGLDLDYLSIALAFTIQQIERIISQLMRKEVNKRSNYIAKPGSSVGAMMLQYTAAALAAEARRTSHPSVVNSIPTSGMQEDLNPMSPDAGYKLARLTEILFNEITILRALIASMRNGWGLDAREAMDDASEVAREFEPPSLTI